MKRFNRFILLFTMTAFVFLCLHKNIVLAQTVANEASINNLIKTVNDTKLNLSSDKKIKLNTEIGNYYYEKNQFDNGTEYLGNAVNDLVKIGSLAQANQVMFKIIVKGLQDRRYTVIVQYSLKVLDNLSELYQKTGDIKYLKSMTGVDYLVGAICNILGNKAYAQIYFDVGSKLEAKYSIKETASIDYVKSNYYYYQGNYENAVKYANSGINISKKENDESDYLSGLIYLAKAQIKQDELTNAQNNLDIVRKSLQTVDSNSIKSEYYYYNATVNEGLGNNTEAINDYIKAYTYSQNEKLYDINANTLYKLGNLYDKTGQYQKSVECYKKYIAEEEVIEKIKETVNASITINMHQNDPQNVLNEIKIKKSQSDNRILICLFLGAVLLVGGTLGTSYKKRKNIKRLNLELNKDVLTKAYNRRYIMSYIQKLYKQKIPFSIAMLDIDNYKSVNDTYGHMFGDIVLKKIVKTINSVAGDKVLVSRYGGEEFLIVFTFDDFDSTVKIAKRIVRAIESLDWEYDNIVTASCGLTKHSPNDKVYKTLQRADELLYVAKRSGKNKVEF